MVSTTFMYLSNVSLTVNQWVSHTYRVEKTEKYATCRDPHPSQEIRSRWQNWSIEASQRSSKKRWGCLESSIWILMSIPLKQDNYQVLQHRGPKSKVQSHLDLYQRKFESTEGCDFETGHCWTLDSKFQMHHTRDRSVRRGVRCTSIKQKLNCLCLVSLHRLRVSALWSLIRRWYCCVLNK